MFDLRANTITALTAYAFEDIDAYYDFYSNGFAETNVKLGKYPVSVAIMGVGDWRIVERKSWSWGRNLVINEIDILVFTRLNAVVSTEQLYDTELANALTKATLGSDDTLIATVRKADELKQIHDNIWSRRWILDVLAIETLT